MLNSLFPAVIGNLSGFELALVVGVVLLLFGPKNLPKLASSMGQAIKNFKKSLSGEDDTEEKEEKEPTVEKSDGDT